MAVGSLTKAAANELLRVTYKDTAIDAKFYKDNPAVGQIPKANDFVGRNRAVPIWFNVPAGGSADFSTAKANQANGDVEEFLVTTVRHYTVPTIQGDVLEQAVFPKGAHVGGLVTLVDGAIMAEQHALSTYLYGNGGGALGQVASASSTTLTLKNINDIVNFQKDMEVESSEADGTSGSLQSGTATVTGIDIVLGTLETDTDWTTQIASLDADDYLFRDGDFGAVISGFGAWVPSSAPSSTAFFGVDRSVDPVRLGGVRYNGSNDGTIEQALIKATALVERIPGARPDCVFMNPQDFGDLRSELGSKAQWDYSKSTNLSGSKLTIGYQGIVLDGISGKMMVYSDAFCPQGTAWMLQKSTWLLMSTNGFPRILMGDGNRMLRESDDAYQIRVGGYLNLGCHYPGANCRVTLPT